MLRPCLFAVLLLAAAQAEAGPVLRASYPERAGDGFFDETPVEPVPGNPGTTLGEQRRHVLEHALDILASYIDSDVTIWIRATFVDLGCDGESEVAVLARGGTSYRVINFESAPRRNVYYPGTLASHIAGERLQPSEIEGRVRFNQSVEQDEDCISYAPDGFWYGIGQPPPVDSEAHQFLSLALHEVGHALGILTNTDPETRRFRGDPPRPGIHDEFLYSWQLGNSWPNLSPAQRRSSANQDGGLVWTGSQGNRWAVEALRPPAEIEVTWSGGESGRIPAHLHGPRPLPPLEGLAGPAVLAENPSDETGIDNVFDEPRQGDDACQPLTNAAEVRGRILLVRRGGCYFRTKWRHAESAGAIAVLAVDHLPADDSRAMQRDQWIVVPPDVSTPLWTVSLEEGMGLLDEPPDRIRLGYDLSEPSQGTLGGLLELMTGREHVASNASHVSDDIVPRSWMASSFASHEGSYNGQVGLVPGLLYDLGWRASSEKRGQWAGNWFDSERSGEGCQLTLEGDDETWILTCYMYLDGEQVWMIGSGEMHLNRLFFEPMNVTHGTGYGPDFESDDVVIEEWGRVYIEFIDCNHASFRFIPDDQELPPQGRYLEKIVDGDCRLTGTEQPDRDWSGNFFNPERSGEGIQISQEANGESIVMTWYSYDDGRQFWAIGTGGWAEAGQGMRFDALYTTRGGDYGPEFDPDSVEIIPFGSAELSFSDCNNAELRIASELEGFSDIEYPVTRIVPRECP